VGEGNVAVIVPDSLHEPLRVELVSRSVVFGGPGRSGLEQQVTLVPVRLVKGLEVDAAVVVEPARIVAEECQGVRSLYVALTRATRRVTVVHAEPLPEVLAEPYAAA
ncbi:MAG: ATP-binding domain-containing protein, partial [Chloroflexota bacterium]|nr:ATP-binding domain-containing protein [Chloroflexota bacterium]